jgi:Tol biopolymer transport system component
LQEAQRGATLCGACAPFALHETIMLGSRFPVPASAILFLVHACSAVATAPESPIAGAEPADALIREGEKHFAHLWKLTSGGENAEGYWSFDGRRLSFQSRHLEAGIACDRIYVTEPGSGELRQVSSGRGATTCSYFLPDGKHLLFASTQGSQDTCPPPPDYSKGYVWALRPEFDVWLVDLASGAERVLIGSQGYDAEATVSPRGDRIVFTSSRSGDLELWTCDLSGGDLRQVTETPGYDGGAFFSHDGKKLVFRSTIFTPGNESEEIADYKALLAQGLIRPTRLELALANADGSDRRQITDLGGANFAPCFFPDDRRVLFASNHHVDGGRGRNFDLFAVDLDGGNLEQITHEETFDSFPLFSPDGRFLVFASNRGGAQKGETNLFLAEWR